MIDRTSTGGRPPTSDHDDPKQLPHASQLTISQHFFIWTLIIVVGVLFGMGGSMSTFFDRSSGPVHGISAREIEQRRDIMRRLDFDLHMGRTEDYSDEAVSGQIRRGIVARNAGCAPTGAALDAYVNHWLDQPTADGHTVAGLFNEAKGGEHEVHFDDLRAYLGDELAYDEFLDRHVYAPAVPMGVANDLQTFRDEVKVDTAVLSPTSFLKPVDPKDPQIQEIYERLKRSGEFERPATVTLTVAYADVEALAKRDAASVTEAEAKAYYEQHKGEPRFSEPVTAAPAPTPAAQAKPAQPKTAPAKPNTPASAATATASPVSASNAPKLPATKSVPPAPPPPTPKPYAQVRQSIIDDIAAAKAQDDAKAEADALDATANNNPDLADAKGLDAYIKAAKQAGLIVDTVTVDHPPKTARPQNDENGELTLTLGKLGTMPDDADIFNNDKQPGFVSRPAELSSAHHTWCLVRLESRTEAGFKTLDEVRTGVMTYLQNKDAYADYIAAAKQARADAQKMGAGGLKAYFASPAGARWKATITSATLPIRQPLVAPPDQMDAPSPSENVIAGSLSLGDHAVALVVDQSADQSDAAAPGKVPVIELMQGVGVVPSSMPDMPGMKGYFVESYRRTLRMFSQSLFLPQVERLLR